MNNSVPYPPITIWVHSHCRSTLGTYTAFRTYYPNSVEIICCGEENPQLRRNLGFDSNEFTGNDIDIYPSSAEAKDLIAKRLGSLHMFCAYHGHPRIEALISEAERQGADYFIASEAPHNMERGYVRSIAKELYIRTVLRLKVRRTIRNSLFLLSLSGTEGARLRQVGWPRSKIEHFGYYPPSLLALKGNTINAKGTKFGLTTRLKILVTGTHCRHKSPITAVRAVHRLVQQGYRDQIQMTITGNGLQYGKMKDLAQRENLPITLLGQVPLEELISLYCSSHLFVATGIEEPWGIRVNDALQLGCPAIVSDGMGASALIDCEPSIGWTFTAGDDGSLAATVLRILKEPRILEHAALSLPGLHILNPNHQAKHLSDIICKRLRTT